VAVELGVGVLIAVAVELGVRVMTGVAVRVKVALGVADLLEVGIGVPLLETFTATESAPICTLPEEYAFVEIVCEPLLTLIEFQLNV
jgi:hypothetical protein